MLLSRNKHKLHTTGKIKERLSFIYVSYEPHCWFWELVEMNRKFILMTTILVIQYDTMSQLVGALAVIVFFLVAQSAFMPFVNYSSDILQNLCMTSTFVLLLFAIMLKYTGDMKAAGGVVYTIDDPAENSAGAWCIVSVLGLTLFYTGCLVIGALKTISAVRLGHSGSQVRVGLGFGFRVRS